MTRLVGNGREARGSIELVIRVDLTATAPEHRAAALGNLTESTDAGSTVEVVVADLADAADAAAEHLRNLVAGGVHVKLCGPPDALHAWLTALQSAS